ncbi:MAG: ABC transporter permease [Cytophagales bacterium]|nr:ABC transporter permease [Cytophagales bacterium]
MFKNYFKIAIRNILAQKVYSFINILGLSTGMAACILILLFVKDELSYDKYHKKSDRIVRVSRAWKNIDGETSLHLGQVAPPFAPLLKSDFEGIVLNAVRFLGDDPLITYKETKIEEERFFFADHDVFEVFSWKLVKGDPATALKEPNSLVITQSTAEKYFGAADPIGKVLNYDNRVDMKVTGVMEDVPHHSHFTLDFLCSFQTVEDFFGLENLMNNWGSNNYGTYLLLPEGYNYLDLQAQLGDFLNKHLQPGGNGRKPAEYNQLTLWPLTSIHLHSHLDSEMEANGDIAYVYTFTAIAFLILVIACINFMNLSTARSVKRAKEVGLRKVMGAYRGMLIRQFLVESVLFAVISLVLALAIVSSLLPWFNNFVQKDLSISIANNLFVIYLLGGITLFVGIAAGSYPALFLSRFRPANILKGQNVRNKNGFNLRSVLVVVQFCISIVLIISVGVIQDQLQYMRAKPLGFNKDNLLILPMNNEIYNQYESIRGRLLQQPGINSVSITSRVPSGRLLDSQGAKAEIDGDMKAILFRIADVHVDHAFLGSFEVPFTAGRDFDINRASDSTESFILNKAAIKAIGWNSDDEAIGKAFHYGQRKGKVIGVVEDFHFESLHQEIAPIVFLISNGRSQGMALRINPAHQDETLAYLKEQWSYLRPGFPFTHYWVNERFSEQYNNEDRLASLVQYFSVLAIIIASLGLFGLASFTAEQRFKEIGVRKVMGASVSQILMLLTRGFTYLVIISFVIGCVLTRYVMESWLQNFAYQTALSLWPFLWGGGIAIFIAWLTVGYQSIKAASTNPIEALKHEE